MSFFDKIYDIRHTDLFKYVFHSGSDEIFVANVSKISTFNKNVLDSKWNTHIFGTGVRIDLGKSHLTSDKVAYLKMA